MLHQRVFQRDGPLQLDQRQSRRLCRPTQPRLQRAFRLRSRAAGPRGNLAGVQRRSQVDSPVDSLRGSRRVGPLGSLLLSLRGFLHRNPAANRRHQQDSHPLSHPVSQYLARQDSQQHNRQACLLFIRRLYRVRSRRGNQFCVPQVNPLANQPANQRLSRQGNPQVDLQGNLQGSLLVNQHGNPLDSPQANRRVNQHGNPLFICFLDRIVDVNKSKN